VFLAGKTILGDLKSRLQSLAQTLCRTLVLPLVGLVLSSRFQIHCKVDLTLWSSLFLGVYGKEGVTVCYRVVLYN